MNEKIRELAEQAGLKYYNWSTNESNIIDGDFKYPRLEDYKKFAELIIRECAEIANNPAPGCHSSFGKIILERFGIKE